MKFDSIAALDFQADFLWLLTNEVSLTTTNGGNSLSKGFSNPFLLFKILHFFIMR